MKEQTTIPISQDQIIWKMGQMMWSGMTAEIQLLDTIRELERQNVLLEKAKPQKDSK